MVELTKKLYHYWKGCVLVLARISVNLYPYLTISLLSLPSLLLLSNKEKERERERERERVRERYRSIGKWMEIFVGVWKSEKSLSRDTS